MTNNILGYCIVPVQCCFNCVYFDAHWCQDQDDDTCSRHEQSVEPNGYCPDFTLDQDISSPKNDSLILTNDN